METLIQNILGQTTTKTNKIQKLILLGLTRKRIAELVTNGNYGFVQNVYAKMRLQGQLGNITQTISTNTFNRQFGVEFEAYNVEKTTLKNKLNAAGINCEIEGYNHTTRSHWKIVTDGSLTGYNTFELVSPILKGESGLKELKTVCRVLGECGAKINKSCGIHVHFDAAGFDLDLWKRTYINYARLERVIDKFMPASRRNNNYCKSLKKISNFESKINGSENLNQMALTVFGSNRYYKINPVSYSRHNTCEFRQHSGTVEYEKISGWIKFLNNLVEFSKSNLITDATLEGLRRFNDDELVNYYKQRTIKLA
ncbi:MAG: amidoligase family protein [Candidatus Azobacteroides sp.]|nr:amidoligase family protein [Candidatus Azobacteroides sp.]